MNDILFFTKGDRDTASSRLRVWQIRDRIAPDAEVIHSIAYAFISLSAKRFRLLRSIWQKIRDPRINILFIQKVLFPWDVIVLFWVARVFLRKFVIFDIDDAEWVHSPYKTRVLARMAHVVFAGSRVIYEWAQAQGARAALIPTVIDSTQYQMVKKDGGVLTIGWIGEGRAHFQQGNFAILKSALSTLASRKHTFRLVIIGSEEYKPLKEYFRNVFFEVLFIDKTDWTRPNISSDLMTEYGFDIGVMPLAATEFNRGKCMFKAIEYMGAGIPVIASSIGEAHYIIEHNKSGFLCSTEEEWVAALEELFTRRSLCVEMGRRGRQIVEKKYSLEAVIPLIQNEIKTLHKIANDGIVIKL
jgi:glycosyltransferase involved in cell wall biosynthesis